MRHDISSLPLSCSTLACVLRLDCGEIEGNKISKLSKTLKIFKIIYTYRKATKIIAYFHIMGKEYVKTVYGYHVKCWAT